MATNEVRVPIAVPVETNSASASDSIRSFRDTISQSKDSIKEAAAAMRDLRGKTDDVKAAKDQLKSKIREEESAITKATLSMLKQGTSVEDVAKKEKAAAEKKKSLAEAEKKHADALKKAAEESKRGADAMGKAIGTAGGPVAAMKARLDSLNDVLGGSSGGMVAMVGIAAAAAAALIAVGAAAAATAFSIAKFVIVSADAARMMQLTRKANLAGRDDWAKNLGDQVDALGRKIPIAKERLNELGISLAKSRIGGQTMVDAMAAVGGATAAAGDDLGTKLEGIVKRGALSRRFQLSPQELMGMDLDFSDVAKAYASGMHMSVEKARMALFEGRVKLSDGAAALKAAVEKKFGAINADKLLGLDNQLTKFKQDLAGLAKDVNLKPVLEGIKSLADNFDQTNVNGKAMRGIVTTIGSAIGVTFKEGVPVLQTFVDKAVWGALKIENYWLRARMSFRETFGEKTSLDFVAFKASLSGVLGVAESFVPVVSLVVEGTKLLGIAFDQVGGQVENTKKCLVDAKDAIVGMDWASTGMAIADGITGGLASGGLRLIDKVKGLADDVKSAFRGKLEIHSPSRAMERDAFQIPAGAAKGVERGTPLLEAAVDAMTPKSLGAGGPSSGGASRGNVVNVTFAPVIQLTGGGDVRAQLADPALLKPLTELFYTVLRGAGIEVPT